MTVTLISTGGIFKRVGRLAGFAADVAAIMGGTATARTLSGASAQTRGTNIEADAAESPAISQAIDGHWTAIGSWQTAQTSILTQMGRLAEQVVITQVDLDSPLQTKDLTTAITELIRQMRGSSSTINASTVSLGSQTALGTPVGGTPVIVGTLKNARGDTVQTPFAETLRFTCASDRGSGATARQEQFSVKGKATVPVTAYNWPGGSGTSSTFNLVDSQLNNAGSTKLYYGGFGSWNSTYLTDFVLNTGSALVSDGTTNAYYGGAHCLKVTGDGSANLQAWQAFNTAHSVTNGAGGTPATLSPGKIYAVNCFVKVDTSAPAAGVLRVALTDTSGTVLTDDAGNNLSGTIDLTAETTSYAAHSFVFCTPTNLPSAYRIELKTTTAVSNTKIIYLSDLAMCEMTTLYAGGPSVAGFAPAASIVKNDAWTIAVSSTMGTLAAWLERFFGMRARGLQFPYTSSSPTVADSVVA